MLTPLSVRYSLIIMKDIWQELQDDLQILALPVSFQMHLDVGDACRIRALSQPFVSWSQHNVPQVRSQLTHEQVHALSMLDMALEHLHALPDCSETTLRQNTGWRRVRRSARMVLLAFDWSLNLPANGATVYQQAKEGAIHEQLA